MDNFNIDAQDALNDALDMIAIKEKENAFLKIQLNAMARRLESDQKEETNDGGNTV